MKEFCIHSSFLSSYQDKLAQKRQGSYEMGVYHPTMHIEEQEDGLYPDHLDNRDANSQTILTETAAGDSNGTGWRKIEDAESVDGFQTTFVNEEAIYVNSTFKGLHKQCEIRLPHSFGHLRGPAVSGH